MRRAGLALLPGLAAAVCCFAAGQYSLTLNGGPSLDGRYLSFADPASGNLIVRDTKSTTFRPLTRNAPGSKEFAYFSVISRDSARVAYAWFNNEGYYDLRVAEMDGSGSRILYRNEQAGFVQPCAWSSDGKQILTLFFRKDNISQIALVPVEGGPPKILRSLNWVYPKRMDLSPDGRHVVYDSFANAAGGDRTVFLLAVDGAKETKLIERPGNHLFPLWTPDGNSVVFLSGQNLMVLPVSEGKPAGEPRLLFRGAERILPMGITRDGSYYYGVRSGEVDVFESDLEAPAGKPPRLSMRFPGRNSAPVWSRDGASLAYLSRRGTENFGQEARTIVIRSFAPDEERELPVRLAHIEKVRWSADGRALLVSGSDNKGRGGLYAVDAKSGSISPLIVKAGAPFRGFDGVWSGDGKTLFYLDGDSELRAGEKTLFQGRRLQHLAASPDGRSLALCEGDRILVLAADGRILRKLLMPGVTELEWGAQLIAGAGPELWNIPSDGSAPHKLQSPGNRQAGFSLHPDGKRIAMTAGRITSEVRVLPLAGK